MATSCGRATATAAGTTLVKDILPGSGRGYPQFLTELGEKIYFRATDGANGSELWTSDGTAAGTTMVKDIRPGSASSWPMELTLVNGTLFFRATTAAMATSCGEATAPLPGTTLVRDVQPDDPAATPGSTPKSLTKVNNTLFFRANDGSTGDELWKSDGTAAGTVLVKDIVAGRIQRVSNRIDQRQRQAVFRRQRCDARHGAVDERRHGGWHQPGARH